MTMVYDFSNTPLLLVKTGFETIKQRGSLYEATRQYWRLNPDRAAKADFVLPVIDGLVRGIFIAEHWHPVKYQGDMRWAFDGHEEEDADIAACFLGKKVPPGFGDQQSPVGYLNC